MQWVMYYNPNESYPESKAQIGRYLGPAIDVGTAMTHKVLLPNGDYLCRASVRAWTPKEERNPDLLEARKLFMKRLHDSLGPACVTGDFEKEDLTPEFQYYADEDKTGFDRTPDEPLPPTPEAGDNYVGARVMLPRGRANSANNPSNDSNLMASLIDNLRTQLGLERHTWVDTWPQPLRC